MKLEKLFSGGRSQWDDKYFEIFKNPTNQEIKECGSASRGYIDSVGNLFLANEPSSITHSDILRELSKEFNIELYYRNLFQGVCVQRYLDTDFFYYGESYDSFLLEKKEDILNKYIEEFYEKNPDTLIKFIPKKITLGTKEERDNYKPMLENLYTGGISKYAPTEDQYFEIYLNPTEKELEHCDEFSRAYLYKTGDLFVSNLREPFHVDIIKALKETDGILKGHDIDYMDLDKGICLVRYWKTPIFGVSTIYEHKIKDDIVNKFFNLAKKKNQYMYFINKETNKIMSDESEDIMSTDLNDLYIKEIKKLTKELIELEMYKDAKDILETYMKNKHAFKGYFIKLFQYGDMWVYDTGHTLERWLERAKSTKQELMDLLELGIKSIDYEYDLEPGEYIIESEEYKVQLPIRISIDKKNFKKDGTNELCFTISTILNNNMSHRTEEDKRIVKI